MKTEIDIITQKGVVISKELPPKLDKSLRSVIKQLNSLIACDEVGVIEFTENKIRRRAYFDKRLYDTLRNNKKGKQVRKRKSSHS